MVPIAQTLPPTSSDAVIEDKKKNIKSVIIRLHDSRGVQVGTDLDHLRPLKERTDEPYGEPTRLQEGMKPYVVGGSFDREGQMYIVVEDPLPATILGFITKLDVGDVSAAPGR